MSVQVLPRDYRVLNWLATFKQLTTTQIKELVFHENHRSICDRAISRLVRNRLIERVEQPQAGGRYGGKAASVYQLSLDGWRLFFTGRRRASRIINPHTLAVADTYLSVLKASRDGLLDVLEWSTEPDSWVDVAGADLRPDLYFHIGLPEKQQRMATFIEVDLGAERQRHIQDKIDRYKYAYEHSEAYVGDVFPQVVFLTMSDDRARDIARLIARTPQLPDELVAVQQMADFPLTILQ